TQLGMVSTGAWNGPSWHREVGTLSSSSEGCTGLGAVPNGDAPRGPIGCGAPGCTGCHGCTGHTGCHGYTGCPECHGLTGCLGCHGCTGHTGCHGLTGCTGCTGCHGCTRHSGCHGLTGCTGCHGCTGHSGCHGYTGHSGCHGHTGCTGLTGLTGCRGCTGCTVCMLAAGPQQGRRGRPHHKRGSVCLDNLLVCFTRALRGQENCLADGPRSCKACAGLGAACSHQHRVLVGFAVRCGGVGVCSTHTGRSLGMKALSCSALVPPMRSGYRCHLLPDWRRQESGLLSTHFCPNYLIYSEHQMPQSFMAPRKAGIWWDVGLLIGTNLSPSPPGYKQKDSDKGPFDVGEAQTVPLGSLCCASASLGFVHGGLRATAPGWAPRGTAPNFVFG
uniref:Uncharacterized protein n=1 Tax=Pavo cristatus TaxID=9049 RepID=A0A8C9FFY1_PAVCR